MKKIAFIILCISFTASCAYKRGSGNIVTENKTVGDFHGISASGGIDVEIKSGAQNVTVEADDNLIKYIEVNVVDDQLKIRLDNIGVSHAHLRVMVTAPEIKNIKASGGSEITVMDELESKGTISLTASGGASIKSALNAPEIKTDASGGAEIMLSGRTRDLKVNSSSGATVKASDLLSENSYAEASSGAEIHINASVSLDATASSGGNVSYRGAPSSVKKTESSGGEVVKKN